MTNDGAAVEVDGLVMRYGNLLAVDGVSFSAQAGEVTVVLGPNGAGKTSTIEHLEGYRRASGGRSRVLGLDPIRDHRELTRHVGVMLQSGGIPTGIRALEVLEQYAGFFRDPMEPRMLLELVGLGRRRRTTYRRLSGGERQRLSFALALVGRPRVVFLDEPTAGVDLEGRDQIRALISALREDGVCVVLTTHDLEEAERCGDHIVIMDGGRVVASGSPAELVRGSAEERLRFAAQPGLDRTSLAAAIGHEVAEESPGEYVVLAPPTPGTIAAVTSWLAERDLPLADLRAGRQRLDDVFRRLTSPSPGSSGVPPSGGAASVDRATPGEGGRRARGRHSRENRR